MYCLVYSRIRKWGTWFAASTGRVPCGAGVGRSIKQTVASYRRPEANPGLAWWLDAVVVARGAQWRKTRFLAPRPLLSASPGLITLDCG